MSRLIRLALTLLVTTATMLNAEEIPSGVPTNTSPASSATDVPISTIWSWTGVTNSTPTNSTGYILMMWATNALETTVTVARANEEYVHNADLALGTTYNWLVIATNLYGSVTGGVWSFTTIVSAQQSQIEVGTIEVSLDNDRDGLPDIWEAYFGLSTNAFSGAEGIDGPYGDPDADGLNNMSEFMAGYTVVPEWYENVLSSRNTTLAEFVVTNTVVYSNLANYAYVITNLSIAYTSIVTGPVVAYTNDVVDTNNFIYPSGIAYTNWLSTTNGVLYTNWVPFTYASYTNTTLTTNIVYQTNDIIVVDEATYTNAAVFVNGVVYTNNFSFTNLAVDVEGGASYILDIAYISGLVITNNLIYKWTNSCSYYEDRPVLVYTNFVTWTNNVQAYTTNNFVYPADGIYEYYTNYLYSTNWNPAIVSNTISTTYTNLITVVRTNAAEYITSYVTTNITMSRATAYSNTVPTIITNSVVFSRLLPTVVTSNLYLLKNAGGSIYSNYTWAVAGLCPTNANSLSPYYTDYWCKAKPEHLVSLGWMFTDHDFTDDFWEMQPTNNASIDATDDTIVDTASGWSTYERCRMSLASISQPSADIRVVYNGFQTLSLPITIYVYSDVASLPDATYTVPNVNRLYTNVFPTTGSLRPTSIHWTAQTASGVTITSPFGYVRQSSIGWRKVKLDVELTEQNQFMPRFQVPYMPSAETSYITTLNHIRVLRISVDENVSYQEEVGDVYIPQSRPYIFEADCSAYGVNILDWNLEHVPTYLNRERIVYRALVGENPSLTNNVVITWTNRFDAYRAIAVCKQPKSGSLVRSVTPTFKWAMPVNYQAFTIELRVGSDSGSTIYNSGPQVVVMHNSQLDCEFVAPILAGSRTTYGQYYEVNKTYFWRVIAMNAKFSDTSSRWSSWSSYRLVANPGMAAINVRVKYFGATHYALTDRVKVQAFTQPDFNGQPISEYTIAMDDLAELITTNAPVVNAILPVDSQVVYIRAYIDTELNAIRDPWDSWGYAKYDNTSVTHFANDPLPVYTEVGRPTPTVTVLLGDSDSDQDTLPDLWEYELNGSSNFLDVTGPVTGTSEHPEINPTLQLIVD